MTTPSKNDIERQNAARQELSDAHTDLAAAINRMRKAANNYLRCELAITPLDQRAKYLAREAFDNRAQWSGGPQNTHNIYESLLRTEAIVLLQSEIQS
jgi:hypothetical protein